MSLSSQKNAIKAWAATAMGITVIWSDQGAPRPAYPYATLRPTGPATAAGGADHRWAYDNTNDPGEEMELTIRHDEEFIVSLQVFAKPAGSHDLDADHYAALARHSLERPTVRQALRTAGCAFAEIVGAQNMSGEANGEWLSRASLDVAFNAAVAETPTSERQAVIEKAHGESTYTRPDDSTRVEAIDIDASGEEA